MQIYSKIKITHLKLDKESNPLLLAAVAGSHYMRKAAFTAYKNKKRSLVTPDILDCVEIPDPE